MSGPEAVLFFNFEAAKATSFRVIGQFNGFASPVKGGRLFLTPSVSYFLKNFIASFALPASVCIVFPSQLWTVITLFLFTPARILLASNILLVLSVATRESALLFSISLSLNLILF